MITIKQLVKAGAYFVFLSTVKTSQGGETNAKCTDGALFTFGKNCNKYIECSQGRLNLFTCGENEIYSHAFKDCIEGVFFKCDGILNIVKVANKLQEEKSSNKLLLPQMLVKSKIDFENNVNMKKIWTETFSTGETGTDWSQVDTTTEYSASGFRRGKLLRTENEYVKKVYNGNFDRISSPEYNEEETYMTGSPKTEVNNEWSQENFNDYEADSTGMTATEWQFYSSTTETLWTPGSLTNHTEPLISTSTANSPNTASRHANHSSTMSTKMTIKPIYTTSEATRRINITTPKGHTVLPTNTSTTISHTTFRPTQLSTKATSPVPRTPHTTKNSSKSGQQTTSITSKPSTRTTKLTNKPTKITTPKTTTITAFSPRTSKQLTTPTTQTTTKPSTPSTSASTKLLWPVEYDYYDNFSYPTDVAKIYTFGRGSNSINYLSKFSIVIVALLLFI